MKHTASAYRNGRCKCDTCTDDHRDRHWQDNQSRRERTAANGGVAPRAIHNYSTYQNWGCRCDACTLDHRRVMAQRRRGRAS